MKLVLYSGGHDEENTLLNQQLIELAQGQFREIRLTFIPSSSYQAEVEFHEIVETFKSYGVKKFMLFPVDVPFDQPFENEALSADIIYLGGGNTYYFLKYLRIFKILAKLRNFVAQGGVLAGLSAGSILMTPNIETAGFPSFDRDENDVAIKNLRALNFTQFHFFPHYKNSKRYDKELVKWSKKNQSPLIACPDGSGVVINGNLRTFVGKTYHFIGGQKSVLNPGMTLNQKLNFTSVTKHHRVDSSNLQ